MKILPGLVLLFLAANCSRKTDTNESLPQGADSNSVHSKVMLDGKVWMTENMGIDIPESYSQQDDTLNCKQYGRLYTWEDAKKGCAMLGKGWRLPTNEEWQTMAKPYGGVYDDSDDKGKSAYAKLVKGGDAEFNAMLGGNREANGDYERFGAHGFYWTATEYDTAQAWMYNFGKGSKLLNHHSSDKKDAVSVRCIKKTEN